MSVSLKARGCVRLWSGVTEELWTLPAAMCVEKVFRGEGGVEAKKQEKEKIKTIHPILEITHLLQWIFLGFAVATVWRGKRKQPKIL